MIWPFRRYRLDSWIIDLLIIYGQLTEEALIAKIELPPRRIRRSIRRLAAAGRISMHWGFIDARGNQPVFYGSMGRVERKSRRAR